MNIGRSKRERDRLHRRPFGPAPVLSLRLSNRVPSEQIKCREVMVIYKEVYDGTVLAKEVIIKAEEFWQLGNKTVTVRLRYSFTDSRVIRV